MSPEDQPPRADEQVPIKPVVRGWRRLVYLVLGGIFFILGVVGALLPGIPATPFLLLTSFFFVRSSPKLNSALLRSRWLGPILVDWQVHGGVRQHVKYKALVIVALMVMLTVILTKYSLLPTILVVVLALVGAVVILRLPTANRRDTEDS